MSRVDKHNSHANQEGGSLSTRDIFILRVETFMVV